MTRDEHRAECIEAMTIAYAMSRGTEEPCFYKDMTAAFDSLHGIAFVDPVEPTEEMIETAQECTPSPYEIDTDDRESYAEMISAIGAVGDLTNPQETKP